MYCTGLRSTNITRNSVLYRIFDTQMLCILPNECNLMLTDANFTRLLCQNTPSLLASSCQNTASMFQFKSCSHTHESNYVYIVIQDGDTEAGFNRVQEFLDATKRLANMQSKWQRKLGAKGLPPNHFWIWRTPHFS